MHSCKERKMMIWSLCLIFSFSNSKLVFASPAAKHLCSPDQKDALWEFKSEFYVQQDPYSAMTGDPKTETWRYDTDCCFWDGVSCDPKTGKVVELDLWNGNLNGPLRFNSSLFRLEHLQSLVLVNNNMSGILPDSIGNLKYLTVLNLGSSKFFGKIPSSIGNLSHLTYLDLSCDFTGELPDTVGKLNRLKELLLVTKLSGNFPHVLLNLSEVTRIDLRSNFQAYFSGWSAMSSVVDFVDNTPIRFAGGGSGYYHKSVGLTYKGLSMELVGSVLMMYITIDVSENRFEGDFPESISLLKELIGLNMSNNAFTGHIPPSLVNLTNLQSLDLSLNRLSGKIPPELGKLTFLSKMNFSHNMLGGLIPQGTQIQSQDISSFAGNPWLCGAPLQETCDGGGEEEEATNQEKGEEDQILSWLAAAIGYVPGVFCGFTIGHILISYKHDWFIRIFHPFA